MPRARRDRASCPPRAREHAAIGRRHRPALDEEDVEARPLGDVAVEIDQHHGLAALVVGLHQRPVHVEPGEVLEVRVHRFRRDAGDVADHHVEAAFLDLGGRDPHVGNGVGMEAGLGEARVAAAQGRAAARQDGLDVGIANARAAHHRDQDLAHLSGGIGTFHAQARRRSHEALDMVVEAEERAFPGGDGVVAGVVAQESPIEDRDLGLGDRAEFPADEKHPGLGVFDRGGVGQLGEFVHLSRPARKSAREK